MKIKEIVNSWSKGWPIAVLLYAVVFLFFLFSYRTELAPRFTDMIGEATVDNISVSSRISFYLKAILLFITATFFSTCIIILIKKHSGAEAILEKAFAYSKVALLFCLQQVLGNEVSFFFGLFFLFSFSLFLIIHLFFRKKISFYEEAFILVAGFILACFAEAISIQLCLIFFAQLTIYILYTRSPYRIAGCYKSYFTVHRSMIFVSSVAIGCVLSYLLLKPEIDLSGTLVSLYKERNFSAIPIKVYWLSFLIILATYLVVKKLYTANILVNVSWLCFTSVFILMQFSIHYLPSLLMLLSFFVAGATKLGNGKRTVELYSLMNDFLLSITFFYLVNQFFSSVLDRSCDFILPVFFLLQVTLRRKYITAQNRIRYYHYLLAVILLPFVLLVSQEIVMLLNQRSFFISKLGYFFVAGILFLLIILIMMQWKPQRFSSVVSVFFALAVAGAALYNAYHPVFYGTPDLFEEASAALAIKRTYLYNEVPLLQHFSPHNLNDYLTGLLYAWFNNDISFGYKIYTCIYSLFFLVYYFFLVNVFNSRFFAVLWTFFSVTLYVLFPFYHAMAVLFFLTVYCYFSNRYSLQRVLSTAILLLLMLLFRPDTGFALFVALLLGTPFSIKFFTDGWIKAKRLYATLLFLAFLIFILICSWFGFQEIWKNIQLIFGYLQSAQSWGYSILSKIVNYKFRVHYFVFPVAVGCIFVYSILQQGIQSKQRAFHWTALIFFCIYYFANFQRGLVRHSFVEHTDDNVSSFVFLIISLFVSVIAVKRIRTLKFAFTFLVSSVLLIWVFKFPRPPLLRSLYSASVDKVRTDNMSVFSETKINRFVHLSEDELLRSRHAVFVFSRIDQLRNYYRSRDTVVHMAPAMSEMEISDPKKKYQTLISLVKNKIIEGNIDEVCYQPLSGYFLNEKPIHFFNQGVHFYHTGMLQRVFVDEMLAGNSRYVLVSNVSASPQENSLDHIPHSVRHYDIFQHVYRHYKPQLIADGMTLWVKDSIEVNANPLFRYRYESDSLYSINKIFPRHNKMLVTVYGVVSIPGNFINLNNSQRVPVAFNNSSEKKVYVVLDSVFYPITSLDIGIGADSISLEGYEFLPDIFTHIPLTYNLRMLPYVLGQSIKSNETGTALDLNKIENDSISLIELDKTFDIRGALLRFVISSADHERREAILQYYKSNTFLGEYRFFVKKGKNIPYLLQVASQPNWNLAEPDSLKLILPGKSYLSKLSIIHKDELP